MTISRKITHTRPNTSVAWHNETTDPTMSSIFKQVEDYIAANYPGVNTVTVNVSGDGLTQTVVSDWSDDNAHASFTSTDLHNQYLQTVNTYYNSIGGARVAEIN